MKCQSLTSVTNARVRSLTNRGLLRIVPGILESGGWIDLGTVSGQPTQLDIHGKVSPGDKFTHVKIGDAKAQMSGAPYVGADIGGVGAVGAEERPVGLAVTVSTDKSTYGPGEDILISGRVTTEDQRGVEGAQIEIVIRNSEGQAGDPGHTATDSEGYYSSKEHIPENYLADTHTITVTASKEGYGEASAHISYTIAAEGKPSLRITVETDRSTYFPGETVAIGGYVTCEDKPVSQATVETKIGDPSGGIGTPGISYTDFRGHYQTTCHLLKA